MASERPWVACLCAAWCVACREYGVTFASLAAQFAADADFAWIDIEDDADALGDLDIENFPTLLIADGAGARFFGTVMPQASAGERLIRGALAGGLASDTDPALVGHVRALVASRRVAPPPA